MCWPVTLQIFQVIVDSGCHRKKDHFVERVPVRWETIRAVEPGYRADRRIGLSFYLFYRVIGVWQQEPGKGPRLANGAAHCAPDLTSHPPPLERTACRVLRTACCDGCSTVVLEGFTCPAMTVGTITSRALDRVRERALGCFARSPKSPPARRRVMSSTCHRVP